MLYIRLLQHLSLSADSTLHYSPEHKASGGHCEEAVEEGPQGKYELPHTNQGTENEGTQSNAKDSVQEKATKDGENNVRPGVQGVEERVASDVNVHGLGEERGGREGERREEEGNEKVNVKMGREGERKRRRGRKEGRKERERREREKGRARVQGSKG